MNIKKITLLALHVIMMGMVESAMAAQPTMLEKLRTQYPSTRFTSVKPSPIKGLYEVVMGNQIAYTDITGRYFIFGNIFDMVKQSDMTAERKDSITRVAWPASYLVNAIKIVKGNGKRKLAVFSDPDCGYCKKLDATLQRVDNLTIYVFLYPIERLHPQAREKAISIWCHPHPEQAWHDWMQGGKEPPIRACLNPINDNISLAGEYQIQGTPTIIAEDGRLLAGAVTAQKIEAWLSQTSAVAKSTEGAKR